MNRLSPIGGLLIAVGFIAGCGLGLMQTAKTTPLKKLDVNLSSGYLYNEMVEQRGSGLANFPFNLGVRYGITDNLDVGGMLFMGAGGLADVKYNFIPADYPFALSLQTGFGVAKDVGFSGATTLHLPLRLIASYELFNGWATPYVGLSYGFFWIRDYEVDTNQDSDLKYAEVAGYGDGILTATLGVELFTRSRVRLLLEYSYLRPVVDNPGDHFSFVSNHMFTVGMRF